MRRVGNKDLQKLVDDAREQGWKIDFTSSGDKLRWEAPRGNGAGFFSGYNAQGNALRNIEGDMKRLIKQLPPAIPVGKPLPIKATIGDVARIALPVPLEKPIEAPKPPVPRGKEIISIEQAVELVYDEIQSTKCSPAVAATTVFNLFLVRAHRAGAGGAPTARVLVARPPTTRLPPRFLTRSSRNIRSTGSEIKFSLPRQLHHPTTSMQIPHGKNRQRLQCLAMTSWLSTSACR